MKLQSYINENEVCNEINDYLNYFDEPFWRKHTVCYDFCMDKDDIVCGKAYEKVKRNVIIALNICTFRREECIRKNLDLLMQSKFFNPDEADYYSRLHVFITDNAGQLKEEQNKFIHINHNPMGNTGGSGGFQYGLDKIFDSDIAFTNVVFMDDDVEFIMETFYRLFALLSYMRDDYLDNPIAGRMFRKDRPYIQYTAAEKWNKGEISHIGYQLDMRDAANFISMNENNESEYGGWWFCCYAIKFVKENKIMPFFLHCDDVEYGLRNGKPPILLNGIQVWHETFEYRLKPIVLYYDTRNSYFVNEKYNLLDYKSILSQWKEGISKFHKNKQWLEEYMMIIALRDFCRGIKWLYSIDSSEYHDKICRIKTTRWKNAFTWRVVEFYFSLKFLK